MVEKAAPVIVPRYRKADPFVKMDPDHEVPGELVEEDAQWSLLVAPAECEDKSGADSYAVEDPEIEEPFDPELGDGSCAHPWCNYSADPHERFIGFCCGLCSGHAEHVDQGVPGGHDHGKKRPGKRGDWHGYGQRYALWSRDNLARKSEVLLSLCDASHE